MTVEALRRRRPETLGELLETYGRELQSVAYLILRDRAEAEEQRKRNRPQNAVPRYSLNNRVTFTTRPRFDKSDHRSSVLVLRSSV